MSEQLGTALVITVSTRAHARVYADESGPIIATALTDTGFVVDGPQIVPDGKVVGWALRDGLDRDAEDLVVRRVDQHRAVAAAKGLLRLDQGRLHLREEHGSSLPLCTDLDGPAPLTTVARDQMFRVRSRSQGWPDCPHYPRSGD